MLKTKGKENILTAKTIRYITYKGTMIRKISFLLLIKNNRDQKIMYLASLKVKGGNFFVNLEVCI